MSSIDERIVKMQFDNQKFEAGVQTSIKSLDALKKGLNLEESAKSLSNFEKTANKFSIKNLSDGIETVASRFTNLGIVGVTALQRITNSAISAGTRIVKALSLDPVMTGFSEYETKMNAITTILTNTKSKGTTLDDVNKALAELNEYADLTIYNFAEMTRNIGTFTAAGIDLDTSVKAIKGIANLAAGSGSSAQQAATAMYQLSQALASGTVKLMDWNSVVNAGMGGELFQNALKETAKQMGIVVDAGKPFRETLQDGWLTSEVLTKTLEKFAEDETLVKAATQVKTFTQLFDTMKESVQSGWSVSWEYIIGDREQAIEALTAVSNAFNDLIGPSTEARNAMLKFWNENGGRDAVIEGISNAFKGLMSVLKPISQAFREVFPATTGKQLVELSEKFRDLTANFKIGEGTANALKSTFKGFFSIVEVGLKVVTTFIGGIAKLAAGLLPVGKGLLTITGVFGDFISGISETITKSNAMTAIFDGLGNAIKTLGERLQGFLSGNISPEFEAILNTISGFMQKIQEGLGNFLKGFNFKEFLEVINQGLLSGVLISLKKFIDALRNNTSEVKNTLNAFKGVLDGVKDSLQAWQMTLKAGTLLKIAAALGILTASVVALSIIDSSKLKQSLGALTVMFIELFGALAVSEGLMGKTGFMQLSKITTAMITFSIAINILASAMKKVSEVKGFEKGLAGVFALSLMATSTAKKLSKASGEMMKGTAGLIAFAAAVNVLAMAVERLGGLSFSELRNGLVGVGVLLTEIVIFLKSTDLDGLSIAKGTGLVILATSMNILAAAVSKFATLDVTGLAKGLGAITLLLTELGIFATLSKHMDNVTSTAIGLTILSGALAVFTSSVAKMGSMSLPALGKGLGGLAAGIVALSVGLKAMNGSLKGSAAMTVAAGAIALLTPAVVLLGGMSFEGIIRSFIALAGAMGIMAGAAALLTPILPAMVALAGALTLVGVAVSAAGAGFLLIGSGLTAIAVGLGSFATLGAAGAVAAANALNLIVTEFANLIPLIVGKIGEGMVQFAQAIGNGAPALLNAFKSILLSFVNAITTTTPQLVIMVANLLTQLLQAIATKLPEMMQAGMDILLAFLQGIANNIQAVVEAGMDIVIGFIQGVTSKIGDLIQAGVELVLAFINGLADAIRANAYIFGDALANVLTAILEAAVQIPLGFIEGFIDRGEDLINGLIKGIKSLTNKLLTTAKKMINGFIDKVKTVGKKIFNVGKDVVTGFIDGVTNKLNDLWQSAKDLASGFLSKVKEGLDSHSPSKKMEAIGKDADQGFIDGVHKMEPVVKDVADEVFGETFLNTVKEAIDGMSDAMKYGKNAFQAYLNQFGVVKGEYRDITTAIEETSKAVTEYGKKLYEESDQYKQDTENLKQHRKELESLQKTRTKIQKELSELNKKNTAESKQKVEQLKSDLKQVNDAIKASNQQIKQDQKDMLAHTKEVYLQFRESISTAIEGSLDPLKASLDTQIDLFKKFGSDTEVTVEEILTNMQSQVDGIREWNANLEELAARGFAKGLLEQLRDMGPSGANYVKAFMQMTTEEMERANQSFQESSTMTAEQLIKSFEDSLNAAKEWAANIQKLAGMGLNQDILEGLGTMGLGGAEYVDAFLSMTAEQIANFNKQYEESLKLPDNIADSLLASFVHAGKNATTGLAGEILNGTNPEGEFGETIVQNGTAIGENLTTAVKTGIQNKTSELKTTAKDTAKSTYGGLNQYLSVTKGRVLGTEMCNGMIAGLESGRSGVTAAARRVAREAYAAAMAELDINSPSKKFEKLGMYSDMGMAKGLLYYAKLVSSAGADVGKSAVSGMSNAVQTISKTILDNVDTSPVIKPILDLSNIKNSAKRIDGAIRASRGFKLSTVVDKVSGVANKMSPIQPPVSQKEERGDKSTTMSFVQNNYSPKALSRIDIYRQTKNQFSAAKGVIDSL